jgi:hypothetical protein
MKNLMTHGKTRGLLTAGVALILLAMCALAAEKKPKDAQPKADPIDKLVGTWERDVPGAPGYRAVKIINRTHFMCAIYETGTGQAVMVGGGTNSFDGKTYKDVPQFGSPPPGGPLELVGKEQVYSATLMGDEWIQEGTMSNGVHIKEVWKRAKETRRTAPVDPRQNGPDA